MEKTIFHILGLARNEMAHSAFIAWMLDTSNFPELQPNYSLSLFLNMLSQKRGKNLSYSPEKLEILEITTEKLIMDIGDVMSSDRIDIFISAKRDGKPLRILIENKIHSKEGEPKTDAKILAEYNTHSQTERYYLACQGDKGCEYHFAYLTEKGKEGPKCDCFCHITYQDIMDYLITPLLSIMKSSSKNYFMIDQYAKTLSSTCPKEDQGKYKILAQSEDEKKKLLEQGINDESSKEDLYAYYEAKGDDASLQVQKAMNEGDKRSYKIGEFDATTEHYTIAQHIISYMLSESSVDDVISFLEPIKGKGKLLVESSEKPSPNDRYELFPESKNLWIRIEWDSKPDRKTGNFDQLINRFRERYPDKITIK